MSDDELATLVPAIERMIEVAQIDTPMFKVVRAQSHDELVKIEIALTLIQNGRKDVAQLVYPSIAKICEIAYPFDELIVALVLREKILEMYDDEDIADFAYVIGDYSKALFAPLPTNIETMAKFNKTRDISLLSTLSAHEIHILRINNYDCMNMVEVFEVIGIDVARDIMQYPELVIAVTEDVEQADRWRPELMPVVLPHRQIVQSILIASKDLDNLAKCVEYVADSDIWRDFSEDDIKCLPRAKLKLFIETWPEFANVVQNIDLSIKNRLAKHLSRDDFVN